MQFARMYWHGCCAICGRENSFWWIIIFDHWIPIADPRLDNPGTSFNNMVPMCHARKDAPTKTPCCNNSKGKKDPVIWIVDFLGKKKGLKKLKEIHTFFEAATLYDIERQKETN